MHVPRSGLAVVGGLHSDRTPCTVTPNVRPRHVRSHRLRVERDLVPLVEGQRSQRGRHVRRNLRSKSGDDVVAWKRERVGGLDEFAVGVEGSACHHQAGHVLLVVLEDFLGDGEREEFAVLLAGEFRLLVDRTNLAEALAEHHRYLLSTAAESGSCAVKGGVTGPQHNDVSVESRWIVCLHTRCPRSTSGRTRLRSFIDLRKERLGCVDSLQIHIKDCHSRIEKTGECFSERNEHVSTIHERKRR